MAQEQPAQTACVILARGEGEALEVCWEQRAVGASFLPGYHAFIGGRVEPTDRYLRALHGHPDHAFFGCALRELCEETGIVLVSPEARLATPDGVLLHRLRAASCEDAGEFGTYVSDHGLRLAHERLEAAGRWTTPPWEPMRYETEFFVLRLRPHEASAFDAAREVLGWRGCWVRPVDALAAHRRGEVFVSGPTLAMLRHMAAGGAGRCDEVDHAGDPLVWSEHVGGMHILPLKSPTLPPATHTNAYILGARRFVVVDPGADRPSEQERLHAAIAALQASGGVLEAVVLTHHHTDHVSGVSALQARFGATPVWAHAETARLLEAGVVTRALEDEEVFEVADGAGQARRWRVLWTPGHAPGHLCFVEEMSGVGLVGDLIASVGTILVQPPQGHMGRYLESLERVRALRLKALLPAHGGPVLDPYERLSFYIAHRLAREAKIEAALKGAAGGALPSELVPVAYADAPRAAWPLAVMSLTAHLERLEELGRARRDGARWLAM